MYTRYIIGNDYNNYSDRDRYYGNNVDRPYDNSSYATAYWDRYDQISHEKIGELESRLRRMDIELDKYKAIVDKLAKTVDEQNKILNDIWYAPGMPGYKEAETLYKSDVNNVNKSSE